MITADALENDFAHLGQSPYLHLQTFATVTYGSAEFPLRAFAWGDADLPVVYVLAGVHGDEPEGIEAALQLLNLLATGAVPLSRHRLLVLPCLNPSGFVDGTRTNRICQDINRQFHADRTQESKALRGFLNPQDAAMLIDLHCDRQTQGFYLFELRDERVQPLGEAVVCSLLMRGVPLEEAPFFAGYTGNRGLFSPTMADLERFQRQARGQALAEWGWGNGIAHTYALESPAGASGAAMHLTTLFALFAALEVA